MTYKTGAKSKLASFWNEKTVKSFQKKIGIHYDENKPFTYKCNGCKGDTQFINCSVCQIRGCAISNKVDHCIDCSENLINTSFKFSFSKTMILKLGIYLSPSGQK